jgi:hypothetical protein
MGASVITAALRPQLALLCEAGESLTRATVESTPWIVVLDDAQPGELDAVTATLESVLTGSTISLMVLPLPFRASAGGARSIGLSHVRTRWFCVLDADDLLPAGALDTQLMLLRSSPDAQWCLGAGETLYQDESRVFWSHDLPTVVPRGVLARLTMETGVMPTIPIAGMWDADLVRALGAWQSLPRDEDTSLKLAATTAAGGVSTPLSTYVYRRDVAGQLTGHAAYTEAGRWCRQAAVDRVCALCRDSPELEGIAAGDWSSFLNG